MDDAGLDEIPLFASLSAHDRRELAQRIDEIDIGEGERLVRQGEFAYEFFVILEGRAEVTRDGKRVAGLGPGDFLGEMGIVGHTVRNASVTTLTPGRARVMSEQDFRGMARSLPGVADRIRAAIEERARALDA